MIESRRHTVHPGELFITTEPMLISTVLGSCVAVCLWDKRTGVSAMNHYLLPGSCDALSAFEHHGVVSINLMIRGLKNRKVDFRDVEAKIFGGANSLYRRNDIYRIGERNAAIAFEVLKHHGINVTAHHVGGEFGRRIVFNTSTGKVRMRLLRQTTIEINEEINKGLGHR